MNLNYFRYKLILAIACSGVHALAADPVPAQVDYSKQIKPLLQKNCIGCHGLEKQKGGLRLDSGKGIQLGGNSGPILKKGKAKESLLFHAVSGTNPDLIMPPAPKEKLTTNEQRLIQGWIDQGAIVPGDETTASITGGSTHWAYQPIRAILPQEIYPRQGNPIDGFIKEKLKRQGLNLSPRAARETLLRRVSLDLTGLPPTFDEVQFFLNDSRPNAYEIAVDRFMASPRFGERWARHWLDLARYADSDGYEKDTGRPFAWRYRQWVIDALNSGLPFDQFTVEQIAGDLLPGASALQKAATGFHRNTLTNKEGGVDQEQFRVEAVIDRVTTTAKVFLGMTFQCAQCHDHKYDPFSQRDFYQFFAFFNNDDEVNLPAPFLPGEEEELKKRKAEHQEKAQALKGVLEDRRKELDKDLGAWEKKLDDKTPSVVKKVLATEPKKRNKEEIKTLVDYRATTDEKFKGIQKKLTDLEKAAPSLPLTQTLALGKGRKTHLLIRGDFLRPGAQVEAGIPAVLSANGKKNSNRLDLAHWLIDPANPLTRRVLANWVWSKFFGRGLVNTLEDFGTQGEKPSHPELLDYLANRFSLDGWSLKSLQRLIVTSDAYCQSSHLDGNLAAKDPYNILLGRQSRIRLDAEPVRDMFLSVSGLMDQRIGGPSVRPPQPTGVSELTYANSVRWTESQGPDRFRRGLYIWFQRTSPFPSLMLFDSPDSNLSCMKRERSNTPLQALALMNDIAFMECSKALGARLFNESGGIGDKVEIAMQLVLSRKASQSEKQILTTFFKELEAYFIGNPGDAMALAGKGVKNEDAIAKAAWISLARMVLNLDEVIVRE